MSDNMSGKGEPRGYTSLEPSTPRKRGEGPIQPPPEWNDNNRGNGQDNNLDSGKSKKKSGKKSGKK
jgi:hypothetical protein